MARMYKTASASPLDYMYKLNIPLMAKVIEANDEYIGENLSQLSQLNSAATNFPYLQADEQRARAITEQYSKQIDDATTAIRNDPANWRKQLDPIRNIGRDLQNNYKVGEISKIAGNYSKYKEVSDYIDDQVKEYGKTGKGMSADRAKAYKQHFLSSFVKANPNGTAYDSKTGNYNSINVFNPMSNIDIRKQLSEELDKMKADGEVKITDELTGSGEYFNKQTQKWESITPERILRIATDRLNNPQIMDYLKQDSQVGLITGVFNSDENSPDYGKFITPYSYDKVSLTGSEQSIIDNMRKQIEGTKNNNTKLAMQNQLDAYMKQLNDRTELNWNNQSYLAPILRGITEQYSYEQNWNENDLSANPVWTTKYSQQQANARNNASISSRERMQQRQFEHQEKMQKDKIQADKDAKILEWNNKYNSGDGKTKPGEKNNTDNAVIGQIYTSPFYWTSEKKDKMTESLNTEINTTKTSINQLEKTLADLQKTQPENKVLIASAQNQVLAAKSTLLTLESQRNVAIDYAINQWKSNGDNYNSRQEEVVRGYLSGKLKTDFDNANAEFQKVELRKKQLGENSPQYATFLKTVYYPARAKKAEAEALYNGGQRVFNNEIKSYANNKLEVAAKETTNRNDIVKTTKLQDERIIAMINISPSNYKIRNSEGKEINLSFEHGTATTDKSNFKINGVAPTTGLGDKQIEIAATINGKNVIITPKDDGGKLQGFFADEFKKSNDKNVKNIGNILSSPTAGTIADMMTEMRMNTSSPFGTKDNWTYRTIPNPANPSETIRIRSRSISANNAEPKWEFQFETNNEDLYFKTTAGKGTKMKGVDFDVNENGQIKGFIPLNSTKSNNGIYHNLEDVISIFPSDN